QPDDLAGLPRGPRRLGHGPAGLDDRADRRAGNPAGSRRFVRGARMDLRRLYAGDGGDADAREPAWRPVRPAADAAGRNWWLRGGFGGVFARADAGRADTRTGPPGGGRRG